MGLVAKWLTLRSAKPTQGVRFPPRPQKRLFERINARVVELVYTHDLKSCAIWLAGSSPAPGTTKTKKTQQTLKPDLRVREKQVPRTPGTTKTKKHNKR